MLKIKKLSAYIAYKRFETFKRPSDIIIDYLNEFERIIT